MNEMLNGCKNFEGNGLKGWNVKKVKNMQKIFAGCTDFKVLDLSMRECFCNLIHAFNA